MEEKNIKDYLSRFTDLQKLKNVNITGYHNLKNQDLYHFYLYYQKHKTNIEKYVILDFNDYLTIYNILDIFENHLMFVSTVGEYPDVIFKEVILIMKDRIEKIKSKMNSEKFYN